jgi:hypothetical protein
MPEITDAVLDQWWESALVDEAEGRPWSVSPLAVMAVITELRELRQQEVFHAHPGLMHSHGGGGTKHNHDDEE